MCILMWQYSNCVTCKCVWCTAVKGWHKFRRSKARNALRQWGWGGGGCVFHTLITRPCCCQHECVWMSSNKWLGNAVACRHCNLITSWGPPIKSPHFVTADYKCSDSVCCPEQNDPDLPFWPACRRTPRGGTRPHKYWTKPLKTTVNLHYIHKVRFVPRREQCAIIGKNNTLMLHRQTVAVYFKIYPVTQHKGAVHSYNHSLPRWTVKITPRPL
jgi:hypothetical protein